MSDNVSYPTKVGTYDSPVALINSIREAGVEITALAKRIIQNLTMNELRLTVNLTTSTLKDLAFSRELTIGEIMRDVNKAGELSFCASEEIPQFVLQHVGEVRELVLPNPTLPTMSCLYFAMQPIQIDSRNVIFVLHIKDGQLVLDVTQVGDRWRWALGTRFVFVQL